MARVVEYEGFTLVPETAAICNSSGGYADLLSNETQGILSFSDPLNLLRLKWEASWDGIDGTAWEGDLT